MKASWTFVLAWLLAVAAVGEADAQTGAYPNKPVQIITDSAAGSTPDVALRIVADGLTQVWKQQVLVNNHPGAGGSLAVRLAAAAAPDGYTLYQPVLSTFVSLRPPAPNVPVRVPQDFLPIGFVTENPMFIAVAPSLGISSLPELIARAKKLRAKSPMPPPESDA
jgi:tripartite-type tricarboxylate transporter receptor subunit TctC